VVYNSFTCCFFIPILCFFSFKSDEYLSIKAVSYKKQRTEIVTILVAAIGEWAVGTGLDGGFPEIGIIVWT